MFHKPLNQERSKASFDSRGKGKQDNVFPIIGAAHHHDAGCGRSVTDT